MIARHTLTQTAVVLGMAAEALAQTKPADKSQYNLFDPTPPGLMREMTTDRPDVTQSPYTIDAGHLQIELSLIEYTRDDEPVASERRPRPERPERPERHDRAERPAPRAADRRGERDDEGVVGFGSDVPAFLARPPAPRPADDD